MHMRRFFNLALTTATLLWGGLRAQTTYVYTDIGNLPATKQKIAGVTGNVTQTLAESDAFGISPTGHVVGDIYITASNATTSTTDEREMTYFNGVTTSFGTYLNGNESVGYGINASGEIAGSSQVLGSTVYSAIVYNGGTFYNLGGASVDNSSSGTASAMTAINASGEATGNVDENITVGRTTDIVPKAVIFEGGSPIYLPPLSTPGSSSLTVVESAGLAINNNGIVAGYSEAVVGGVDGTETILGAVFQEGTATYDVGTLAGSSDPTAESELTGIDKVGDVCGWSDNAELLEHAILYTGGKSGHMTDLGTLPGGLGSIALGMNDNGVVVGYGDESDSSEAAWVWTAGGGMVDLNTLTSGAGDWFMEEATAVNNAGQIVGIAVNSITQQVHAFLLTPTALAAPPTVSTQPVDFQALVGQNITIASNITGGGDVNFPMTFQWYANGVAIAGQTSANLTFPSVQLANSANYSVTATNLVGTVSTNVTMTVIQPATIVTQPGGTLQAFGGLVGRAASVTVGATGSGTLTYQWEVSNDSGNTYTNVVDSSTFSGATGPTLTIAATTLGMNGQLYQCIINNEANIPVTTVPVLLEVGVPPTITIPPGNLTVNQGDNANLTVTTSGTSPIAFQWSHAGIPISGATNATLSLTNAQTPTAGSYTVVASNALGTAASTSIVTVILLPDITKQPANVGITAGKNASFSVTATGTPTLTYDWQISTNGGNTWSDLANSAPYSGVATSTLLVTNATLGMDLNEFRCVLNNPSNVAVPSNAALLTVGLPPTIATGPLTQAVNQNTSPTLSVAVSGNTTPPISYQWKFAGLPISGATGSSYTIPTIQAANAGTYSVVVTNPIGNATASANVSVIVLPVITSNPANSTVIATKPTSFKVTATGTPTLTYQWQQSTNGGTSFSNLTNVAPYSGVTTATLAISNATLAMNGTEYQVVVNNPSGVANTSIPALLSTGLVPTIANVTLDGVGNHTTNQNASITLSVTPSGTAPFTYQWYHAGTLLTGAISQNYTIPSPQAADAGAYSVVVTNAYGSVTSTGSLTVILLPVITSEPVPVTQVVNKPTSFKVTATGTATLTYQWQESINGGGFSNLTNTPPFSGVTTSILAISNATLAMNGTKYQVVVNNPSGVANTSTSALLNTGTAPTIITPPGNQTINQNSNTTLSVTANGSATLNYEWTLGSSATILSTNSTYTITNAQAANAGKYSVVVSSPYGVATASANLTVINLPTIVTQPGNLTIIAGKPATFKVVAGGTPTLTYQWQAFVSGNWTTLTNNATVSGVTTSTLTIPVTSLSMNGTQYRAIVNNGASPAVPATSNAVLLNVGIPPTIASLTPANLTINQGNTTTFTVALAPNTSTTPLTYAWTLNGVTLGNATNSTLTITNAQGTNGGKYSVLVSNAWGNATASTNLTVVLLPVFNQQPPSTLSVAIGKTATITVVAGGSAPITYQWQMLISGNWTNITNTNGFSGATTASLSIAKTTSAMTGQQFRAIINNASGVPSTSSVTTLSVGNPPTITSPPSNQTATSGGNVTFSVTAAGDPTLTYQWYLGANPLSDNGTVAGSATATLTLTNVTTASSGNYFVTVTNAFGNASAQVMLTVNPSVVPALVSGGSSGSSSEDTAANSSSSTGGVTVDLAEPGDFTVSSGELASVIIVPGSMLTPADVSAELLSALNLNADSNVSLLPSASTVESGDVVYAQLQFRQAKTAAGLSLTVEYGYAAIGDGAPTTWLAVPSSAITQLPDADVNTSVYQASIPVPQGQNVYFRISTSE
jgi:probable HAF family extracellular repeat protein